MFSLLVKHDGWDPPNGSIELDRVFEQTDPDVKALFIENNIPNLLKMSGLRVLFIPEPDPNSDDQYGRVGNVFNLSIVKNKIEFSLSFDDTIPPIPMKRIKVLSEQFGTVGWGLNRTHWAIKNRDLFEMLFREQLTGKTFVTPKTLSNKTIKHNQIALMMPFAPIFDLVRDKISEFCAASGFVCLRADDIWKNDTVIQDVYDLIVESNLVIFDLSQRNPNVFYEAGIAHALGKNTILITQSENDIPFDVIHWRYVKYLGNEQGINKLIADIRERVFDLMSH